MWKKILAITSFLIGGYVLITQLIKAMNKKNNSVNDYIIFKDLVKTNQKTFIEKVVKIANDLEINVNWLMAVMYKESRLNERAYNSTSKATGLIQFMPNTARGLGTDINALIKMSNVEQLDWVYKYFKPYKGKMNSFFDTYIVVFFPIAVGKPDDWILKASGLSAELIGRQNPGINGGKPISVRSFKAYLLKSISKELHKYLV